MNKYVNDIYNLIKLLEEKHIDCYFHVSKEELKRYINDILKKYKLQDDYDFYYVANMIIKKLFGESDSHTKLIYKNVKYFIPIRLKYIDGKLYIIKTDNEHRVINYSQILKINDVDIGILINELEQIISYSTKGFLYSQIEYAFCNSSKMKSLPSIDNLTQKFKYTIIKDNKEQEVYLAETNANLSEDINYTFETIDGVMIIHYTSCVQKYDTQMLEFIEKIRQESIKNNIQKYIIDIRGNVGGNSEIIKPLIAYLQDKEVVTLVDKYVFSGGRFALIDLINIGAKTVGTGIGTSINCFGNISRNEIGNFIVPISNKYFYFKDSKIYNINKREDFLLFKNNNKNQEYFIPTIYEPDYIIENQIEDYVENRDAVLECAIEVLNEEKINHK